MAVTEVVKALGEWSLHLRDSTPRWIVDLLDANPFGHIVIDAARDNPELLGDSILPAARYVGVLRGCEYDQGGVDLKGAGMAFWLGDEDGKGDAIESAVTLTSSTFTNAIRTLLPPSGAVTEGTLHTIAGTYTQRHIYQSRRAAIDYCCDLFDADWRVNGDATLDAGLPEDLFVTTPVAAVIRRADGVDMALRALPGEAKLGRDVEDFSTRVVTVAEGNGRTVAVGTADIAGPLNPYLDLHGNSVKLTRLVSESNTSLINADARAQLQLNRFTSRREALALSSTTHDIRGDVAVGDSVWVFDPDANLVDTDNEIVFRGERIAPVKLRVYQLSWPVVDGMGVYFRTGAGTWVDLSDHVVYETGQTTITVGDYNRSLTNSGIEPLGGRVVPDSSVPAAPTLNTPFTTSVYQSTGGLSRARIIVAWDEPLNADGTVIADGSHYEVQYRISGQTEWQSSVIGWDFTTMSLLDLTPASVYEIRVRAVDVANPPNLGAWSSTATTTAAGDTIAPATPAAATVAGNPVSIQVLHTLGAATGGTYNLAADLHHLEVHASAVGSGYTPDATTKLGDLAATNGMMLSTVPALGTFTVSSVSTLYVKIIAVDESGNRSSASAASTVTATLIDSAHISDLTATKITTGDLTATVGLLGLMRTATSGARFEAGVNGALNGFRLYRSSGTLALKGEATTGSLIGYATDGTTVTFELDAAAGTAYMRGTVEARQSATDRIVIQPSGSGASGVSVSEISLYAASTSPAYINAVPLSGSRTALGLNSGNSADSGTSRVQSTLVLAHDAWHLFRNTAPGAASGVNDRMGAYVVGTATVAEMGVTTTDAAETRQSIVACENDDVIIRGLDLVVIESVDSMSSATRDGGYVWLRATTSDTYMGHFASGVDSYLRFAGSDGDVTLRRDTNQYLIMDGTTTELEHASGIRLTQGSSNTILGQGGSTFIRLNNSGAIEFYEGGSGYASLAALKSFIIPHPNDTARWLVHGCTESPVAGIEQWGETVIRDGQAEVVLPGYFEAATRPGGRQVQLSPVDEPCLVAASPIVGGRFTVRCSGPDGTRVAWLIKAVRADVPLFDPEPLRSEVTVRGDGPYRYLAA